jgi:chitinase
MMKLKSKQVRLTFAALGCLLFAAAGTADDPAPAPATPSVGFHVVGYLPEYRGDSFDVDTGRYLTDLIYFSAEADPKGELKVGRLKTEHIRRLQELKRKHQTALLLCVGGWGRSAGFSKLAASAEARARFVEELLRFCRDQQFDGVDLDWEHPEGESQQRDHALLLTEIHTAFAPQKLQLTIAVAGWQALSPEAIRAVDRVHLMAYDGNERHATFESAESDVARLVARGVPPENICLGVPFYGRGIRNRSREMGYAQIVKQFSPAADVDEVDGIYFNGRDTIERKTKFARQKHLAGIMAWELGQDTRDDSSLLRAISRAAR